MRKPVENPFLRHKLKQRRTQLGLSLQNMADLCGLSKTHVWDLERRPIEPSGSLVFKISQVVGVSMDFFYTEGPALLDDTSLLGLRVLELVEKHKGIRIRG